MRTLLELSTPKLSLAMTMIVELSFSPILLLWVKRMTSLFPPLRDIFPFLTRVTVTIMAYSLRTLSNLDLHYRILHLTFTWIVVLASISDLVIRIIRCSIAFTSTITLTWFQSFILTLLRSSDFPCLVTERLGVKLFLPIFFEP